MTLNVSLFIIMSMKLSLNSIDSGFDEMKVLVYSNHTAEVATKMYIYRFFVYLNMTIEFHE